ncbi:hypothetical protein DM01DRAFT_1339830 [Hesseltinella vesiculosa]|uniref:Zn(2)-C6 fungal-type domain-containing protein n=1 Tax=Hesseltinella vesiculosa TaxID=101127 RepID=A0A1X2G5W4_9FUNG|nr:hypothetical protein DM01DRAFT_1339830 [Hesseltinella vesiculosa]
MDAGSSQSQQIRPFVYIQYPNSPSSRPFVTTSPTQQQQPSSSHSSPQPSSSSHSSSKSDDPPPPKRKRQQNGYACDKCRERRVGCDRDKPICGQCKGKYQCGYSNHALRLDNVSMRQKMNDLETQVKTVKDDFTRLQQICQELSNRQQQLQSTLLPYQHHPSPPFRLPLSPPDAHPSFRTDNGSSATTVTSTSSSASSMYQQPPFMPNRLDDDTDDNDPLSLDRQASVMDWALGTGWQVSLQNGITSIFTNIASFDDLRDALRRALQMTYHVHGPTLYATLPEPVLTLSSIPTFSSFERLGRIHLASPSHALLHAFFLLRFLVPLVPSSASSSPNPPHEPSLPTSPSDPHMLASDVMYRLIHQHHQCSFPILVSPSRFERHYQQGELKSVVLSSIFSHIAPHACLYHPHLVHLQDFRTLGQRFYEHSRMQLGLDDQANLSNIHQRTLLLAYDLDFGRVDRAYVQLGLVIRMCFSLDLHRPEGYAHCQSPFEREQAKRIFWAVWFFDSMIPHFFAQPPAIRREDIKIDPPCVLSDYDPVEVEQTRFAIALIQMRRLHSEKSLRRFYRSLAPNLRFRHLTSQPIASASLWQRRSFFCILLDYCLAWINIYRHRLPSSLAIRRTSQAAFAMLLLFRHWFQPEPNFDCFFRPYLHHFMAAIQVFKSNILQADGPRSPMLVAQCKAALIVMYHIYRTTPTYRSFGESQLEKDLILFFQQNQILTMAQLQYGQPTDPDLHLLTELLDDGEADYGWSIFSLVQDNSLSQVKSSSGAGSISSNATSEDAISIQAS